MSRAPAPAKVNLALVVGPLRDDRKHEVLTVLQRIDLVDRIELEQAPVLGVEGYAEDTLVRTALRELAHSAGARHRWRVRGGSPSMASQPLSRSRRWCSRRHC